jgi:hypothetical protein
MYLELCVLACLPILTLQLTSDGCDFSETCVPIRSCDPIIEELQAAKQTSNKEKKREIVNYVKSKICGERADRLICCPGLSDENAVEQEQLPQQQTEQYLGDFVNIFHDIGGEVYAVSDNQLLIKGFTYDGEGPDAFFLAGESGSKPNARATNGDIVLAYPYNGADYEYLDSGIPILPRFNGDKEILLTLPKGVRVADLKWLSVWCRDYKVNFGHSSFQ